MLFVGQFLSGIPFGLFSSVSASSVQMPTKLTAQSAVSYASDVTPVSLRGYLTVRHVVLIMSSIY